MKQYRVFLIALECYLTFQGDTATFSTYDKALECAELYCFDGEKFRIDEC